MAVIGKIRQNVGLLVAVIAVAILSFLFMDAVSSSNRGGPQAQAAGTVNGEEISYPAYEARAQRLIENQRNQGRPVDDRTSYSMREQAWNQYVQEMLANSEYEKLGIMITDEEMEQILLGDGTNVHPQIASAPLFQNPETKQFDRSRLEQYVASFSDPNNPQAAQNRAIWKNFEESVLRSELQTKYGKLVSQAVFIPDWYAKQDYANKNTKANIEYVHIPYSTITDGDINYSDSDLKSYLRKHASEYDQEESRSVEYVSFPIKASAKDTAQFKKLVTSNIAALKASDNLSSFIKNQGSDIDFVDTYITKAELTAQVGQLADSLFSAAENTTVGPFYDSGAYKAARLVARTNAPDSVQFRQIVLRASPTARKKMDSIKALIDGGADFGALASELSEDPTSKANSGDMGYVTKGSQAVEVANAIFYDNRQGARTVVETPGSIHLVEITKAVPTTPVVKVAVLSRVIEPSDATRNAVFGKAQRFASTNRSLDALRTSAEKEGLTVKTLADFNKNAYDHSGLGVAQNLTTWAYKNSVGSVTDRVFEVETTTGNRISSQYIVAALAGVKAAGTASVNDKRAELEGKVKNAKKAEKIIAKIGSAADIQAVASAVGQEVKTANDVSFSTPNPTLGNEPKVQAAIFGTDANQLTKPIAGEKGVYVVKVLTVTDAGEAADLSATKTTMAGGVKRAAEFNLLQTLSKAADVEDNRYKVRTY